MFWIIALVIFALAVAEGYFIGAVRAAFAFLGLVLGCLLAVPLTPLAKPVLSMFGVHHFLLIAFLGPVVVWIVLLLAVRAVGESLNYKVNYFYKYKVGDEMRLLWQRLSQRLGACVGVLNGSLYLLALSVLVFSLGYPLMQVASSEQDPFMHRVVNQLAQGLKSSSLDKAVAPFVPTPESFYNAADVIGLIYQNPQIQSRLGKYPPFMKLKERPEYAVLASDKDFQTVWKGKPPFAELIRNDKIVPLVTNEQHFKLIADTLGGDVEDLLTYLETGTSPKYADNLLLGEWRFALVRSNRLLQRGLPNATVEERLALKAQLQSLMGGSRLTAFPDNDLLVRARQGDEQRVIARGTWKRNDRFRYTLTFSLDGRQQKAEADVEEHILTCRLGDKPLVFLK